MSKATWEYVPATSGPGHLQRVADDAQFTRVHRAYRAYLDHTGACSTCAVDTIVCAEAEAFWQAYQATLGT